MFPRNLQEAIELHSARAWVREPVISLTFCSGTWTIDVQFKRFGFDREIRREFVTP